MAAGGGPVNQLPVGQTEFFEHICIICEENDKTSEAKCKCLSCDRCLCNTCWDLHKDSVCRLQEESSSSESAEGDVPVNFGRGEHDVFFDHTCTGCEERGQNTEASCYCPKCDQNFCTTCQDVHEESARDHALQPPLPSRALQPCTRCRKHGRKRETGIITPRSSCYCRSCDQYFCPTCWDVHEEFASEHESVDSYENNLWGRPRVKKQGMEDCPLHEGQTITTFCEQHDTLGCDDCDHSSCEKNTSVTDLAKDISNRQELEDVRVRISTLEGSLKKVKTTKEQMQRSLNESKTNCKKTVEEFKTKVNNRVDQLYKSRYNELEDQLEICDTLIWKFANLQTMLTDDNIGDTKRFVMMKYGKEKILECVDVLNKLSQPMDYDIVFPLDKDAIETIESKYIGQFSQTSAPGKSTEITGVKNFTKYSVRTTEDRHKCDIRGMCMLADGTVILSDHKNRNIKRLDETYAVREVYPLPEYPEGVCCIGKRLVAVALEGKKVQIVSVTDKMRKSEDLVFRHSCDGIVYFKGRLYITSGGFGGFVRTLYEYELQSDNTTYTLVGTIVASHPRSVAVSGDGQFVYLVGIDDKLTIRNRQGEVVQSTEHPTLRGLNRHGALPSVCVDMKGNVIVSVKFSGIIHFKDSGTKPNGILIPDEVTKPDVVFVDHVRSKLIVNRNGTSGGSDTVGVWDLEY